MVNSDTMNTSVDIMGTYRNNNYSQTGVCRRW